MTPAINLTACKYELKLEVPSAEGMTEMYLRFNSVSKAGGDDRVDDELAGVDGDLVDSGEEKN